MTSPSLARRLGTPDAVVIGLGAMVGAGVFAAFAPAAEVAGPGLLIGLAIAGGVAYCNAVASAQLAAQYPVSGGTYYYGRQRLGEWWGFTAGWGFVMGKTASCGAMALTFATYAVDGPEWVRRLVALAAVVLLVAVNYRGVTKTAAVTRVLVAATLLVLLLVVVLALLGDGTTTDHVTDLGSASAYDVLQAAGLLFFAFAGYARIATLGEEVREPETAIPRAIVVALTVATVVYLVVGVSALLAAGADVLADAPAPLAATVEAAGAAWAQPIVRVGAAAASLGSLLVLIAGIGRTALAMARNGDLPRWLDAVHRRHRTPHHAELVVGVVVGALVLTTDLRGVLAFSSFGVLTYYAIANASAYTQDSDHRRWPRVFNVVGVVGCAVLAVTLPWQGVVSGVVVLAVGLAGRAALQRNSHHG